MRSAIILALLAVTASGQVQRGPTLLNGVPIESQQIEADAAEILGGMGSTETYTTITRPDQPDEVIPDEIEPPRYPGFTGADGVVVNPDGTVTLGIDVLAAMGNDTVRAKLAQVASETGHAPWWAKILPILKGVVTVPATMIGEQAKTTVNYAKQSPGKMLLTAASGYVVTRAAQGKLDDDWDSVVDALGGGSSSPAPTKPGPGIVAEKNSRVTIKDASSIPANITAKDGSEVFIDVYAGDGL